MKTLSFLLLMSISTLGTAQSSDRTLADVLENAPSKFIFGWVYSPEVSYRILTESDQATGSTPSFINTRNEEEGLKYGQTFNFFFGYQFASKFRLEAGLGFTDYGERIKPFELMNWGGAPGFGGTASGTTHFFVSTLPINLQFQMGSGKIQGFISAGVTPGLVTRYMTTSRIEYNDGSVSTGTYYSPTTQDQFTKFILSATISGGIDYRYSKKASFRIAPVFRMMTNSVNQNSPVDGYYFNAGIEFGSVYHL
jgi:hypothetical protein